MNEIKFKHGQTSARKPTLQRHAWLVRSTTTPVLPRNATTIKAMRLLFQNRMMVRNSTRLLLAAMAAHAKARASSPSSAVPAPF